ncbi:hypothetical protein [Rugamonas sp.]|uniref:hypothetical protein n=1 Tax=Rugamonas sp. TaxID=1926287 RepID=UPI0025D9DB21|nr:hypothetical protein [Rugamonas sp.]
MSAPVNLTAPAASMIRCGTAVPSLMWVALVGEEVITQAGPTERIHTGIGRSTKHEAFADAEALDEQLGAAALWFGVVLRGERKQIGGAV